MSDVRYLNAAQQEALAVSAHTEVDICGRRFGKSFGIISLRIMRNVLAMPGSTGAFVASSYKQARLRTLPAALSGLQELAGWVEGVHYVIGKKPPQKLGYGKPMIPVLNHDDVVTFFNGAQMIVLSQDVKMSSNSLTLDWIIGDEAKGLDFAKLKDETFPANGGTTRFFGECPWHHSVLFVTDMPILKSGNWLFKYQDACDEEVISVIKGLLWERWRLTHDAEARKDPECDHKVGRVDSLLRQLRRKAVFYREWSTFENIDVVGLDYIRQMKRDLPPLVFQTSILSKRVKRLKDGFYPNFRENLHTYICNNNTALTSTDYGTAINDSCLLDGDVDLKMPISIAFDYNANINWLVCGQRDGQTLKILKSFFVKYERKLRELVDDFCHYYRAHISKTVVFYYDSTALGSNYAVSDDDFRSVIIDQFTRHGWYVVGTFVGKPMRHSEKYSLLNDGFTGKKNLIPMFNKEQNEALLIAISLAEVAIVPGLGFGKNKGGEKLAETEADLLEHRTDGTDAFDTLYIGNVLYPYAGAEGFGSGV